MDFHRRLGVGERLFLLCCVAATLGVCSALGQEAGPAKATCRVEPIDYKGWSAQQLSNQ